MQLSNSCEIARDIEEVFDAFLDIEPVAGTLPGATLTRMVDDSNFEGEVKAKIGPLPGRRTSALGWSANAHDADTLAL